jgi:hypothetical protein
MFLIKVLILLYVNRLSKSINIEIIEILSKNEF